MKWTMKFDPQDDFCEWCYLKNGRYMRRKNHRFNSHKFVPFEAVRFF